jgi:FixJ family two-component response regulator
VALVRLGIAAIPLIDCVRSALRRDRETRCSISEIVDIREQRDRLTEREREVLAAK